MVVLSIGSHMTEIIFISVVIYHRLWSIGVPQVPEALLNRRSEFEMPQQQPEDADWNQEAASLLSDDPSMQDLDLNPFAY